jgi:SAM-dependent methyltransferase
MAVADDIRAIIESLVDLEPESFSGVGEWESPWTQGTIQHRQRVEKVAEYAVERFPGDIIEIGCHYGQTTAILARIAERHGRRVIGVDPWKPGTQDCVGHEYKQFLEMIEDWKDIVDVVRLPSESEEAIAYIANRALCFAYIDGLHTYSNCYSDIMATSHAPIIIVDDIIWNVDLERAFNHAWEHLDRPWLRHPLIKEGYILQ